MKNSVSSKRLEELVPFKMYSRIGKAHLQPQPVFSKVERTRPSELKEILKEIELKEMSFYAEKSKNKAKGTAAFNSVTREKREKLHRNKTQSPDIGSYNPKYQVVNKKTDFSPRFKPGNSKILRKSVSTPDVTSNFKLENKKKQIKGVLLFNLQLSRKTICYSPLHPERFNYLPTSSRKSPTIDFGKMTERKFLLTPSHSSRFYSPKYGAVSRRTTNVIPFGKQLKTKYNSSSDLLSKSGIERAFQKLNKIHSPKRALKKTDLSPNSKDYIELLNDVIKQVNRAQLIRII